MPLFGRAHECKEYERWSEKQVWIGSVMKWALPKNQGDPHKDANETRTHSGQKTNNEALILKCLWSHTEDLGSLQDISKSDSKNHIKNE